MRISLLALFLLIPLSLTACGKKGALYLPDEASRQQKSDHHLIGPIMAPTASTHSDAESAPASSASAPFSTQSPVTPATPPGDTPLPKPK